MTTLTPPERAKLPSADAMLRSVFGVPRRRFTGPRASYVDSTWERCKTGKLGNGHAYELAYDPKAHQYHVTVIGLEVDAHGNWVPVRDARRDRAFGAIRIHQRLILRARNEALVYLRELGAQISPREFAVVG